MSINNEVVNLTPERIHYLAERVFATHKAMDFEFIVQLFIEKLCIPKEKGYYSLEELECAIQDLIKQKENEITIDLKTISIDSLLNELNSLDGNTLELIRDKCLLILEDRGFFTTELPIDDNEEEIEQEELEDEMEMIEYLDNHDQEFDDINAGMHDEIEAETNELEMEENDA